MTDRRSIALLLALHLAIVAIVQPRGDFPLNDDWAYAHSVQWLLAEGRIRLSDWIAMNLLPQTLAGGLVTFAFGFSFETLRHVTQLVAAVASVTAYFWFRTVRLEPVDAFVASVAVVAFPAWPVLANSYMTDLYGLLFALPSATFFLRALKDPTPGTILAATLFALVGTLQRQVVLVLPAAFMLAWLWSHRQWTLRNLTIGIAPYAVVLAAEIAYVVYLGSGPGIPEAQQAVHGRVVPMILKIFSNEDRHAEWVVLNVLTLLGYFGLFCAGWMLWWGWDGLGRRGRIAITVAGVAIAATALTIDWLPPYRKNFVFDAAGIGPFTIYDAFDRGTSLIREPGAVWRLAAIIAALGAACLLALLWNNVACIWRQRRNASAERIFLVAVIAAYLFPFTAVDYIDRYLLFVLPFIFALWAITWPRAASPQAPWRHAVALGFLVVTIALAAAATHDYFAWNRARWDAIRAAENLGATAATLDGGFEYNAFRRFETRPREKAPGKSWWWVKDDEFIVAFIQVPGYEEIRTFPVRRWLRRTPPVVRLLRRI